MIVKWGRLTPGSFVRTPDETILRVAAVSAEEPGMVLLETRDGAKFAVTRPIDSDVEAKLEDEPEHLIEQILGGEPIMIGPFNDADLARHLVEHHGVKPTSGVNLQALHRHLHDTKTYTRPHRHMQKESTS